MGKDKEKSEKKRKRESLAAQNVDAEAAADVDMANGDVIITPSKKIKVKDDEKDIVLVPVADLSPIANPLAQKKLLKRVQKTVKRASKVRQVKRGVKEVVKGIRKGDKGLLVLAADITPIDIISHLPVLSEEAQIPYIFVPSKEELGRASATKRPTSCVLVCPTMKRKIKEGEAEEDYTEEYETCMKEIRLLNDKIAF